MPAPPTEETLLATFLLPPAPLHTVLSLKGFTALFPKSQKSSPMIRTLYRDLQAQRVRITDLVGRRIVNEAKRGKQQRRAIAREKKQEYRDNDSDDDEVSLEETLLGPSCNLPFPTPHTLKSIIPEMELAVEAIEVEIQRLEKEEQDEIERIQDAIGCLSDLRYGKLANPQLKRQVIEGCLRLEGVCEGR